MNNSYDNWQNTINKTQMNIHIIGGGNLGVAIALGLARFSKNNHITVTRRKTESILYLEKEGITVSTNNTHEIEAADIIILTIKPYQVDIVLQEILPVVKNKIIASAVSGLSIDAIQSKTDGSHSIIHIMPNIAALFGESATCISHEEKSILFKLVLNNCVNVKFESLNLTFFNMHSHMLEFWKFEFKISVFFISELVKLE